MAASFSADEPRCAKRAKATAAASSRAAPNRLPPPLQRRPRAPQLACFFCFTLDGGGGVASTKWRARAYCHVTKNRTIRERFDERVQLHVRGVYYYGATTRFCSARLVSRSLARALVYLNPPPPRDYEGEISVSSRGRSLCLRHSRARSRVRSQRARARRVTRARAHTLANDERRPLNRRIRAAAATAATVVVLRNTAKKRLDEFFN